MGARLFAVLFACLLVLGAPAAQAVEDATTTAPSVSQTLASPPAAESTGGSPVLAGEAPAPDDVDDGGGVEVVDQPGASFTERFLQRTFSGLMLGCIIAMTAVGLSLVFGTTGLINFAHGEFVTVGAITAYVLMTASIAGVPLPVAAIGSFLVGGLLAAALELGLWRPMRRRKTGLIQMFIISIGVGLFLRYLMTAIYGGTRNQYPMPTVSRIGLGPIAVAPRDLIILGVSAVILVGVATMLKSTRIGKATRAVSDNPDLARASGINVDRVILVVWVVGGSLAGLSGVLYGWREAVWPEMGFQILLLMFAAVVLGGLGSAYGAMLGALIIGLVAQWSTLWFPNELMNMWALLVLILVLLVRPQGILGRAERAG